MPRFFIDGEAKGEYLLTGEEGRHASRVLRLRPGEELILCNENGREYICRVIKGEEAGLWVQVENERESLSEPKTKVTVCQCLPKGDKLEAVTQKAVELGAVEVWPLLSSRCVSRPDVKSGDKKVARLQRIALEAAKQSGRGAVPRVLPIASLREGLERASREGDILFFYEAGEAGLKEALKKTGDRLFVFIGPEGGFSKEEAELAASLGAAPLTLGRRILRTETAPIAALAAIFYERGDMEK